LYTGTLFLILGKSRKALQSQKPYGILSLDTKISRVRQHKQKGSVYLTKIVNLAASEEHTVQVPLTDLISLKATSFILPEHAMRPIDQEHVIALAAMDGTSEIPSWPPLEVVSTDQGLAIIDGYHREAALLRNIWIDLLKLEELTPAKQSKAILSAQEIAEETARFEQAKAKASVLVHIGDYASEKEVAKAALTANLKHGLPPKSKALVHIAMELFDVTRGESPEPGQAEIARIVGISRATLNEYLKKREKEQAEAPAPGEGEEQAEAPAKDEEELTIDKAVKKAQALVKFLEKLYDDGDERAANEGFHVLFEGVINSFINEFFDRDSKELAETIRHELGIAPVTLENELGGYVKFGQAFLQAMKLGKAPKAPAKKTTKGKAEEPAQEPATAQ
jgi:hypothetical protein